MLNNIIGEYMGNVELVWVTPEAEKHIMYCARVSNPKNQDSGNTGLLNYCVKHGHWSVFEMASMCVEINTTRAISPQILRHRSFSFQEFSQRYAEVPALKPTSPRMQDTKNRQNSFDNISADDLTWWDCVEHDLHKYALEKYQEALDRGIAKESARFLLPGAAETKLYMNGTIRSFIHYLQLRTHESTQKEHRDIAEGVEKIFAENLPIVYNALKGEG